MAHSVLGTASELLRQHYGCLPSPGAPGAWRTLVAVVLGRTDESRIRDEATALGEDALLSSPSEMLEAADEDLEERLKGVGHVQRKCAVLRSLARWWLKRFGEERDSVVWDAAAETFRHELVRIPGVSLELADRLLLFVGDLSAYPVDRAAMRVACRHGWMDAGAEYEEWQSFFVRGLEQCGVPLAQSSIWASRLGKDFCGPTPRCQHCPLKPLLPPSGPYTPEMD